MFYRRHCNRRAVGPNGFLVALTLASAPFSSAIGAEQRNTCVECHVELPDPLGTPVEQMKNDVHAEKGLSCADCHGGDPTILDVTSMDPEKGYVGVPTRAQVPEFCARCHADEAYMRRFDPSLSTDQLAQYRSSIHGLRLRQGDQRVATCVSCHGAHGILSAAQAASPVFPTNVAATCGTCHSNPTYMADYGIATNQEQEYRTSIHAEILSSQRDFSAPTCNDCHGNHGAFPPGVTSIAEVCGQCHAANADRFRRSPHQKAFDELALPECATCHGNHAIHRATDAMLGVHEGSVCIECHDAGSEGYAAAADMSAVIEKLQSTLEATQEKLNRARSMGMEVSEQQYVFGEDVRPQLIKARTAIHEANVGAVRRVAYEGTAAASKVSAAAQAEISEARSRRRDLLVPLGLIILLMALIYRKLRQLEATGDSTD